MAKPILIIKVDCQLVNTKDHKETIRDHYKEYTNNEYNVIVVGVSPYMYEKLPHIEVHGVPSVNQNSKPDIVYPVASDIKRGVS